MPIQGVSFAHTLDDAAAATRHHTQYFEMLGHRAIYHDGWRAVCPWPGPSFSEAGVGFGEAILAEKLTELDATGWELYHLEDDFAENHDVAEEHRDKLIALIGTWSVEAGKYDVMPVDGSGLARMAAEKPLAAAPRDRYVYMPGTQSVPFVAGPRILNRPHSITADVEIPDTGAEGVLLCQGTAAGGYSLFVKDGRLHYVHNYSGGACIEWRLPNLCHPVRTNCGLSSSQPASRTSSTGAGHLADCSSTSTGLSASGRGSGNFGVPGL